MGDPRGSLRRCRLCSQNAGSLFESPDYTTEVPGVGSSRILKGFNPISHSGYGVVISCIAMYVHKSKDIAVMYLPIHLSHYSHVCYVVVVVHTAVAKSRVLGRKAWQSLVAYGNRGLWSFLLAKGTKCAMRNTLDFNFATFRPQTFNSRLRLIPFYSTHLSALAVSTSTKLETRVKSKRLLRCS